MPKRVEIHPAVESQVCRRECGTEVHTRQVSAPVVMVAVVAAAVDHKVQHTAAEVGELHKGDNAVLEETRLMPRE